MTCDEFNKKWEAYLEDGFYGIAIPYPEVIAYLDREFTEEVKVNPSFSYSQIKMKFGTSRVYASSKKTSTWESEINKLIHGT
jgi:hypothetical protein